MLSVTAARDKRAVSLVEMLIAMFLLLAGFLIVFRLFQVSLQYNNLAQKRLTASRLAAKTMEEIRAWARDPDNYDKNWDSTYPGTPYKDLDEASYTITVRQKNHEVLSPCTSLEQRWVASTKERRLQRSFRRVTVIVAWSDQPSDKISITSLVGDPPRELASDPISVNFASDALAAGASKTFTAALQDKDNNEIPDVCFEWYVVPARLGSLLGGNGIIDHDLPGTKRTGRSVVFRNAYPHPGEWISIAGNVRMRVVSRYRQAHQTKLTKAWENLDV